MGIERCGPAGGRAGVDDHTGAPRGQARIPHRQPVRLARLDLRRGQRVTQPAFGPAPAAMEPRQPAVGMPQGAQGGRDAFDRLHMRSWRAASRIA